MLALARLTVPTLFWILAIVAAPVAAQDAPVDSAGEQLVQQITSASEIFQIAKDYFPVEFSEFKRNFEFLIAQKVVADAFAQLGFQFTSSLMQKYGSNISSARPEILSQLLISKIQTLNFLMKKCS